LILIDDVVYDNNVLNFPLEKRATGLRTVDNYTTP
jgi:hypothetical protein